MTACPHFSGGRCVLAEQLLQREIDVEASCPTTEQQCARCVTQGQASEDKPTPCVLGNGVLACPPGRRKAWQGFCSFVLSGKPRGLGDRIEKVTSATGIKRVVKAVAKAAGVDCGCSKRQKKLNEAFPS